MGVDIYGRMPKLKSERPDIEWDKIETDKQRTDYIEEVEQWENDNPGYYFRSNWWAWRPIMFLSEKAIRENKIDLTVEGWDENSGMGPEDGFKCLQLASALEKLVMEIGLEHEQDCIYINLGAWADSSGRFVKPSIEEQLNEEWTYGDVRYTQTVGPDGNLYAPAHSTPLWLINKWINFLKECGGFEVN